MIQGSVVGICLTVVLGGFPAQIGRLHAQESDDSSDSANSTDGTTRVETDDEAQARVAYTRFLSLLQRQPRHGTALDRVYGYHVEQGTLDAFIASLREQGSPKDDNGASCMLLGLIELQRGRDSEAASAFREAETQRAADPLVSWYLGGCLLRLGQAAASTEALERAIQKKPDRNDLLQIFQDLGRAYRQSQQPEKSNEVWQRMEEQFPQDLRVKEQIATILQDEGDFEAALIRFSELATLQKDPYQASQNALTAAELKLQLGRTDEALRDFEQQLGQLDPDSWLSRETRRRIENIFLRTDDFAGLVSYYENWLTLHPEDLEAMTCLGRSLAKQGRYGDAQAWYAKALKRAPSNVALREAMIEQLIRGGHIGEAIAQYEQLRQYDNGNADHVEEWGLLYLNRRDLPQDEQRSKAAAVWKLLLTDRPNDPVTVIRVAELLRRAELTDAAIEHYRRAISLAPAEAQYREYLGDYLYSLKRTDEAFAIWNSIAEGPLRTTVNLVQVAEVLQSHGEKQRALATMRDACEITPAFGDRVRYVGMLRDYEKDGSHPFAEESLRQLDMAAQMAESAEDRQLVVVERIRSLLASGLLEKKTQELAAELQNGNTATAAPWRTLSKYYESANQLPSAIDAVNKSLTIEPESVESWTVVANLYEKAGRNADAANANRRLTSLDRRSLTEYLKKIATLEQKLGRMKEALQAAKDLIAAAPGNPEHFKFYADLCFHLGQKDEGLNALRRAVRANSSDENAILSLAGALANQMETTEAIDLYWRAFERATDLDTKTSVISSLAELYLRTNQFDRLVHKLELRGRELNQQRDSAMCLATVFRIAGDLQSSRRQLEGLLTADSRDVGLLAELSKIAEEEDDLDAAADYQRRINSAAPSDEGRARLAGLLLKLGDISEAEALLVRASDTKSEPHEVFRSIDQLIEMESVDSAREICDRILQREPENWEAMVRIGVIEWRSGGKEKAADLFGKLLALQLNPEAPSAETAWTRTRQKAIGDLQPSSDDLLWPLSVSRGNTVHEALSLLETFGDAGIWSSSQMSELMPDDFREARVVCLAAQLLIARDSGLVIDLIGKYERAADPSRQSALDMFYLCELQSTMHRDGSNGDGMPLKDTFLLATRLAESNDFWKIMFLMTSVEFLDHDFPLDEADPNYLATQGPDHVKLSSDQVALMLRYYETLLTSHPEWLAEFNSVDLCIACEQTGEVDSIDALIRRMNTEQSNRHQLQTALDLSLRRRSIGTDDALKLLDRIVARARQGDLPNLSSEQILDGHLMTLMAIVAEACDKKEYDSALNTLDWWLKYRASVSNQGTQSSTSVPAIAAAQEIVTRTLHMDREMGIGMNRNGRRSGASKGLGIGHQIAGYEFLYLSQIDALFAQAGRHDELLEWCAQREVSADDDTAFRLDLAQAFFCWQREYIPEAVLHLIHAAELAPTDISLHLKLVELTESLGQKVEALALLDQLPDSDPVLLKAREIKALDLAMKVNNKDRARLAAERLYGLQLDPKSEEFLLAKLGKLGLREMAAQVKARTRTVTSKAHTMSPLELLEQYEKQGNTQAAAQVAQQLVRRTAPSVVSQSSRFSASADAERIRERAFQILKQSGELEKMIERQRAQLETSPNSKVLLQTLVEYLDQAGKADEASAIRDRITPDPKGNSAAAIISDAEQFEAAGRNGEACDKYLELLQKHPNAFRDYFYDFQEILISENRMEQFAEELLKGGDVKVRGTYAVYTLVIGLLADQEKSLPVCARLLQMAVTEHPANVASFVGNVDNLEAWQHPEMFAVLSPLYMPQSRDEAVRPRLGWELEYDSFEVILGFSDEPDDFSGGYLGCLFSGLSSPENRTLFRDKVLAAQAAFPEWPGAEMLLAMIEMRSDNGEENTERLIRQWIAHSQQPIPEPVAMNVASLLSANSRLKPLAIELLNASLLRSQPSDIDFVAPAAGMLNRLYAEANQRETGREFILQHLPASPDRKLNPNENVTRATGSRLAAARAMIALKFPVEALKVANGLTSRDVEQYLTAVDAASDQRSKSREMLKAIMADAARLVMPLDVVAELKRTRDATDTIMLPQLDLQLHASQGSFAELNSDTLKCLPKLLNGGSDEAELQQLADSLDMALNDESADASLIIVGVHLLLTSQNAAAIAKVTPSLATYLGRPIPKLSAEEAASPDFLRRHGIDMGFACVAAAIKGRPEFASLVRLMLDRSIAIARLHPDRRYLSGLLYQRGEMLNAAGDKLRAEESWSEMLELVLAEPEDETVSGNSRGVTSSKQRPAVNIGEEMRKTLLKAMP